MGKQRVFKETVYGKDLNQSAFEEDVTFKVDYIVPSIGREFGSVFLGDKNVALMVVSDGWVKVREQGQPKGDTSPFLAELLRLGEQAKQQRLGRWTRMETMDASILETRLVEGTSRVSGIFHYKDMEGTSRVLMQLNQLMMVHRQEDIWVNFVWFRT